MNNGTMNCQHDPSPFADMRRGMIDGQLRRRGIHDARVLEAMGSVPREEFVAEDLRDQAYDDCPLPIGHGQTISQPFTVAYMLQELRLQGDERVLDVGTGSGYAAAVLSCLVREVHSVERIAELAESARARLIRLGFARVQVHTDDGTLGCPAHAPFQAIVVAAATDVLPDAYPRQLSEGGRIVIPIGNRSCQTLYRYTKHACQLTADDLGQFMFVPLVG
jgi:protein-L-isoaspartate(D-aspartate) O-methyltransferase